MVAHTIESNQSADFAAERQRMVREQIGGPGDGRPPVRNSLVLKAMQTVERHKFVPPDMKEYAYQDSALRIGHGQTISQPYMVAVMTELAHPSRGHVVLEVGTGSGYQAAILAEIVEQVYTIEIVEPLGLNARDTLIQLGYDNIEVRIGDGYQGWEEKAPFDSIIVTAAPDHVPAPLVEQLKIGGRLVIPVGPEGGIQELRVLQKQSDGSVKETDVMSVRFVPLVGDHAQ
ncbi:MAG: protein-L-isoaspartate(D-aspartate) O-methyltransferase [Gammaproteobacteria bacterium]|nr:protein-L-isoaspartate(D-aspartate) O-methyltransferase [Gammaproteobacteria bacterium]